MELSDISKQDRQGLIELVKSLRKLEFSVIKYINVHSNKENQAANLLKDYENLLTKSQFLQRFPNKSDSRWEESKNDTSIDFEVCEAEKMIEALEQEPSYPLSQIEQVKELMKYFNGEFLTQCKETHVSLKESSVQLKTLQVQFSQQSSSYRDFIDTMMSQFSDLNRLCNLHIKNQEESYMVFMHQFIKQLSTDFQTVLQDLTEIQKVLADSYQYLQINSRSVKASPKREESPVRKKAYQNTVLQPDSLASGQKDLLFENSTSASVLTEQPLMRNKIVSVTVLSPREQLNLTQMQPKQKLYTKGVSQFSTMVMEEHYNSENRKFAFEVSTLKEWKGIGCGQMILGEKYFYVDATVGEQQQFEVYDKAFKKITNLNCRGRGIQTGVEVNNEYFIASHKVGLSVSLYSLTNLAFVKKVKAKTQVKLMAQINQDFLFLFQSKGNHYQMLSLDQHRLCNSGSILENKEVFEVTRSSQQEELIICTSRGLHFSSLIPNPHLLPLKNKKQLGLSSESYLQHFKIVSAQEFAPLKLCCALYEQSKSFLAIVDRTLKTTKRIEHPQQQLVNAFQVQPVTAIANLFLARDDHYVTLVDALTKKAYTVCSAGLNGFQNQSLVHFNVGEEVCVYALSHDRKKGKTEVKAISILISS